VIKKDLTPLVVFLCLLLIIRACTKTEKNSGITTLRFVTFKPDQPEVWNEAIKMFEKENSDISIKREFAPHSTTAFHDLLAQKLKNRSSDVDVFFMDVIWPPEFAAAGWTEPLDSYIDEKEN